MLIWHCPSREVCPLHRQGRCPLSPGKPGDQRAVIKSEYVIKRRKCLWLKFDNMVKDHIDSKRGNLPPPYHGWFFPITSKGSVICWIVHTTVFCYTKYLIKRRKCLWLKFDNMVKDHIDSKRGNLPPPYHGLFFPITSKGSVISCIVHTTVFCYTNCGALAGMNEWMNEWMKACMNERTFNDTPAQKPDWLFGCQKKREREKCFI